LFVIVTCSSSNNNKRHICIKATDNCPNEHIKLYLYTKYVSLSILLKTHTCILYICLLYVQSKTKYDPVELTEDSIENIKFAMTIDLKVLIHGIKGSKDDDFNTAIRDGEFQATGQAQRMIANSDNFW